jgi:hypothetical protein
MQYRSKDKRATRDSKLVAGIKKLLATSSPLPLGSNTMTIPEIVSMLEARLAADGPVVTAKAAWMAEIAKERALIQQSEPHVVALRKYLEVIFGDKPEALAEFGIVVKKPRVLTSEELAMKTDKARKTRQARKKALLEATAGHAPTPPTKPVGT